MRNVVGLVLLMSALVLSLSAQAVIETYDFSDKQLEQRYQKLSKELRCPKCQNQDIADSNAPIAQDLRKQLYKQLEQGATDDQILDYMVDRYGEFVRYRPRFEGVTAALWLAPVFLLLIAVLILLITLRRRSSDAAVDAPELTAGDQDKLQSLLDDPEIKS